MKASRLFFAGALLGLLAACPSFVTLQTAHALDRGQLEVTAAASAIGTTDNGTTAAAAGVQPTIYLAGRFGVADGFDVGAKIEPVTGFVASATAQLVRSHTVDVALAPDVGFFQLPAPIALGTNVSVEQTSLRPNYEAVPLEIPVLVGINFGDGEQLVLGPRVSAFFVVPEAIYEPSGGPTSTTGGIEVFAGGSVGVSFKAGPRVRVMPEIDITKPVAWTGESDSTCGAISCAPYPTSGWIYQVSVGLALGLLGGDGFW